MSTEIVRQIPRLTIIRGAQGSGKSTLAKRLASRYNLLWVENDQYPGYFDDSGNYQWALETNGLACKWCEAIVRENLISGKNTVVSNTFRRSEELATFLGMAETMGVSWTVIECKGEHDNVHGVPQDVVQGIRDSWIDFIPNPEYLYYISNPLDI